MLRQLFYLIINFLKNKRYTAVIIVPAIERKRKDVSSEYKSPIQPIRGKKIIMKKLNVMDWNERTVALLSLGIRRLI